MEYFSWIGFYTLLRRTISAMFRTIVQSVVTPLISAALFIFVFGSVVGTRIADIGGVEYVKFVLPGILMMNIVTAGFFHTSFGLYFARFVKHIEELLVSPLSYLEIMSGYLVGAVLRATILSIGILVIAVPFGGVELMHPFAFLWYLIAASIAFGLLGLIVGLWANSFEQLNVLNTFVLMPFSFLGGMFYTIDMLPESFQTVAVWNPLFHLIDGMRYAMIGVGHPSLTSNVVMIALIFVLGVIVHYLFKSGWRLRE